MIRTGLAGVMLLALAGCGAAPAWLTIVAPTIGWIASINNAGTAIFKFTHDKLLVCPLPLAAGQPCPVAPVEPVPMPAPPAPEAVAPLVS